MNFDDALPWWQALTPRQIGQLAADDAVAVLPLAAIEQHGEHLPLSTDLDIALGLLCAARSCLRASLAWCVLPPLCVGLSLEHTAFPGTLSLTPETALAGAVELGESVRRAGIRRLVLFNSHGGNSPIVDLAALKLRADRRMLVVRANYLRFAPPPDAIPAAELRHGIHGGALETAMMLHLAPHKVRTEALGNFHSLGEDLEIAGRVLRPGGQAGFGWMAQDLNPAGVVGNAMLADAALGARLVDHFAATLARVIEEAADFDLSALAEHGPRWEPC
ncbi:MAG: creatininase family protein [Proteobacteria bacterium]|nr:creatininase family protein [Pseudomonadota bacterium]